MPSSPIPLVDYPAGHSMDTEWFALDEEGHVAAFTSYEAGAVPRACLEVTGYQYSADTLCEELLRTGGANHLIRELAVEPDGRLYSFSPDREKDGPVPRRISARALHTWDFCILWLRSEEALEGLAGFSRVPGLDGVFAAGTPSNVLDVEAVVRANQLLKGWSALAMSPERCGIFCYEHGDRFENWTSGPYQKVSSPARPLCMDELPEAVAPLVSAAWFSGVRFAQDSLVQPVEHVACSSHQRTFVPAYCTADERLLWPVEGREAVARIPGVHVMLSPALGLVPPAERPAQIHASGPIPRFSALGLARWLASTAAEHAAPFQAAVVRSIVGELEAYAANPVEAREAQSDGDALDAAYDPDLQPAIARLHAATRFRQKDSGFVNVCRFAACVAMFTFAGQRASANRALLDAIGAASNLFAAGVAPVAFPSPAAFAEALDQQMLRLELEEAFSAQTRAPAPAVAAVLWRAGDGDKASIWLVRLASSAGRYGLLLDSPPQRRWLEGTRDDVLASVPDGFFDAATAAVLAAESE